MKPFFQRHLLLVAAAAIALTVTAALSLFDLLLFHQFSVLKAMLTTCLTFAISYLLIQQVVNQFIYKKIKLIYKTIHNLKTPNSRLKAMLQQDQDVLETVNKDVVSWAETKQQEIQVLRNKEEFRREFLGNVSHELKTPIFNIQGYIHTLLDGGLEDQDINRKFLLRADKSVERMISVVEDLDVIWKLESGQAVPQFERINIVELVKEVMEMEEMKAEKKGISIAFDARYDKAIYVRADGHQIRQIYINLMDNAINYGSKNGHILLRFHDMDQHILCEVADNGPGIHRKHLPRLFERFYRVDKSRDRHAGGTGLGLSIVKHIIEAHEQTINVRSKTGENAGTTFSFTLQKWK